MASTVHLLGFSGSLRRGSFNTALLRTAAGLLPPDVTMETFDLAPIPLYNGDVEAAGFPEPVVQFKQRIAASDALLIVTPEYNYSIPGVLKNAIDWASRPPKESPLQGKPVAFMGGGGLLGSARAQYHLRQVCVFNNMLPIDRPELFVMHVAQTFDANLNLTDDATRELIRALLVSLADWTRRLRGG